MVISDVHRFVFIEVPHTASHSIGSELRAHFEGRPILRKHANLSQYLRQATPVQRRYFKFATVRNPLDTTVTHYLKLKFNHRDQFTNRDNYVESGGFVTPLDRQQFRFVNGEGADFSAFFKRFRRHIYNNWFLLGHDQFDFIIRFENLQRDYLEAMRRIGLTPPRRLPHVNRTEGKSERDDFIDYYTTDIRGQVQRCYGPFLRKWKYEVPANWDPDSVQLESRIKFALQDGIVNFAARFMSLAPDSGFVTGTRAIVNMTLH